MKKAEKILIAGVGSILRGDDGIGMRVIDRLKAEDFPENISLHGADISGLDLLKYFPAPEGHVIIIDAADMNEEPGTVKVFDFSEIKKAQFNDQFSTHGMGLLETLTIADKLGLGCRMTIIGIQPQNTGFDLEISLKVKDKIPEIVEKVKELIGQ